MTKDELTMLHLMAMGRWDMDSAEVDQALKQAGLNPNDPRDYTKEQAVKACQDYHRRLNA